MSQELKLPKAVKRITVVQVGPDAASSVEIYRADDKQKKQSKGLRVIEKLARQNALASRTFAETYADRHRRSNRKKRDGWLRDLAFNLIKASGKARQKIRLARLFGW